MPRTLLPHLDARAEPARAARAFGRPLTSLSIALLVAAGLVGCSGQSGSRPSAENRDGGDRDTTSTDGGGRVAATGGVSGTSGGGVSGTSGGGVSGTSGGGVSGTSGGGSAGAGGSVPLRALDMNDVTILTPLPPSSAAPVLLRGSDLAADGTVMVPRSLYDRVIRLDETDQSILAPDAYGRLHLVAVRFDLCDRHLPGACPQHEDGRLRLVFQPVIASASTGGGGVGFDDAGFHAFYAVRNGELSDAVAALRTLAKLASPQTGGLRVSLAFEAAQGDAYAAQLRAFVKRYGGETRLVRLTVNAQPVVFGQVRWALRGVERREDVFVDMPMVGAAPAISAAVILEGAASYSMTPATDTPTGLIGAITKRTFDAADASTKRDLLGALVAADNPLEHTAETVPCAACHLSTVVMRARTTGTSIDPVTLPGRFTSSFDLSVAGGKSSDTERSIRALGYFARDALISQRVANETAQTLSEIETRYPAR